MNGFMREHFPVFEMTQALRPQIMDLLTDEDLGYKLPGQNPSLGELCRDMGEIQHAYIDSFKTHKLDPTWRGIEAERASSVARLNEWFQALDTEMNTLLREFSDDDLRQMVDRGSFALPVILQALVYKEAMLVFYSKAVVYLKALEKSVPPQVQEWIG